MQSRSGSTATYTHREIHTIDSARARIEVTLEAGTIHVAVDDYSGQGPLEYIEPDQDVTDCSCQGSTDLELDDAYEDGFAAAVHVIHRQMPGHWGPSNLCYDEPCATAWGQASLGSARARG
ncbi:hypothetical protein JOD65_000329 [Nocardioides cavernae]|nr:hypothetical protein [Nocardioides cavernae]